MANNYSIDKVFERGSVNGLIDLIFSRVVIAFPPGEGDSVNDAVYNNFVLSGKPSAILQGAASVDLKNIPFEVAPDIFGWLQKNAASITGGRVLKFTNATFLYKDNVYFEFWIQNNVKAKAVGNIYIQDILFIPENLL